MESCLKRLSIKRASRFNSDISMEGKRNGNEKKREFGGTPEWSNHDKRFYDNFSIVTGT